MSNIMYRNSNKRLKRRDKTNPISTTEQIQMNFKIGANLLSINQKLHMENHWGKEILIDRFSTRLNPNMNDLMSVDFAIRDWMDDTDCMLPRICMEYPKVSTDYTSKKRD